MRVLANKNARLLQNLDKLSTREKLIYDQCIMKANAKSPKAARAVHASISCQSNPKLPALHDRTMQAVCCSRTGVASVNLNAQRACTLFKYKKAWIYDCLLLKIKSTVVYTFLHENEYLPLPNPRTLYTYLRSLKADFGFDSSLFTVLKDKLQVLPERERRGVLMFDEMSVRKSVHIRESDMALLGKVNFAEHTRPSDYTSKEVHSCGDIPALELPLPFWSLVVLSSSHSSRWSSHSLDGGYFEQQSRRRDGAPPVNPAYPGRSHGLMFLSPVW
ncbi:hypothetical protein MRX96_036321 [Rhipicephalus microplus]